MHGATIKIKMTVCEIFLFDYFFLTSLRELYVATYFTFVFVVEECGDVCSEGTSVLCMN